MHKSRKPEFTIAEEWWEETRAKQEEACKDDACREEVDRIYDRIRDEAMAKPDPNWGEVGTQAEKHRKPEVYWPCGEKQPFHLPGHPSRPLTFESCADGSCGPPIQGDYKADWPY